MKIDLTRLVTESRNPASEQIDTLPTLDMLKVINQQDQLVALAVAQLAASGASGGGNCDRVCSRWTLDLYGRRHVWSFRDSGCK